VTTIQGKINWPNRSNMCQTCKKIGEIHMMSVSAFHRFDLEVSSCNKEVEIFNRKLQKKMKIFNHTGITNISSK
jgi:hypothetical protein